MIVNTDKYRGENETIKEDEEVLTGLLIEEGKYVIEGTVRERNWKKKAVLANNEQQEIKIDRKAGVQ